MRDCARVCESVRECAKVCKSVRECAKVCESVRASGGEREREIQTETKL